MAQKRNRRTIWISVGIGVVAFTWFVPKRRAVAAVSNGPYLIAVDGENAINNLDKFLLNVITE